MIVAGLANPAFQPPCLSGRCHSKPLKRQATYFNVVVKFRILTYSSTVSLCFIRFLTTQGPLSSTFVVSFDEKFDDFVQNSKVDAAIGDADVLGAKAANAPRLKRKTVVNVVKLSGLIPKYQIFQALICHEASSTDNWHEITCLKQRN